METNVLIAAIAVLNLIVISMMFLLLWKEMKRRDGHQSADKEHVRSINNAIMEKIDKLEKRIDEKMIEKPRFTMLDSNMPENRIKTALEKLNRGIAPDAVCRELGYSRSEIGILLASARHGKTANTAG